MDKSEARKILEEGPLAGLYAVLTPMQQTALAASVEMRSFKKGQIIYHEHDTPHFLWCLLRGKVKKFKSGAGERMQIIRLHGASQCFGYRAYFAQEPYVSTAAALEDSDIAAVPMQLVEKFTEQNHNVAMYFIRELARNLGGSDSRLVNLTQKHTRGRLAEALLVLRANYGLEADGATLNICPSREDLANLASMVTSNAIRTLSSLVEEKVVLVDGRRIKILDPEKLAEIARQ